MRTLILLSLLGGSVQAADNQGGWIKAPLMRVLADYSLKEVPEHGNGIPAGQPAFQTLAIRKGKGENTWIVSGTVCSTNAGGPDQGAGIYVTYPDGRFQLIAMANLKGEVLFSVYPMNVNGKPVVPAHLYVSGDALTGDAMKGALVRRYVLRARE